jgi:type I restriction enzyme S subunit
LFKSQNYISALQATSNFIRDGQDLNFNNFCLVDLPLPPQREQNRIARFLDWKTSQINRFIRNKRRFIELLKEQKQNIINQAVTRGLDPKVKFKPSGMEWIGDIPEHWEVRRLKFLCHNLNEQTSEKQSDETYIALEHVESWTGRISLPDEDVTFDSQVKRFRPGDVLFGKLRPYLAKVTRPRIAGICVGEFLVLRATGNVSADFLEQKLRSKRVIDLINSSTFGAKMPRADWTFIGNLKFAYPPADEQQEILEYIQEKSAEIDQAISRAQREIELMREYRTRLISDVVTGQVDVRGIDVPEVADEELLALEESAADADDDDVIDDEGEIDETD